MTATSDYRQSLRPGRRVFLKTAAAAALCFQPLPSFAAKKPSDKLNIAAVGLGARGLGNVRKCEGDNIVALCDVDQALAATAFDAYPRAARYKDFRKMLDREPNIDAVLISTPDHTHAVIAAEAMKRGKHVYLETPLAHDVWEARQLARIAGETGVITQMGNERHSGAGIRKAVEMLWGGGLGPVREVHCWTNRPQWPQGMTDEPAQSPPPAGLDWDLWLGPISGPGYNAAYHPYRWRGWRKFGTGAIGAMGCNLLDVAFWGLNLSDAKSFTIDASSTNANDLAYPEASTVKYHFDARGDMPPVVITWYDGGRLPPKPKGLPYLRELGSNGTLFIGDECSMLFGPTVFGTNPDQVGPCTIPEHQKIRDRKPVAKIPRVKDYSWQKGNRHIQEWIAACRTGAQPCANFQYSAALTEMVLLGNIAITTDSPITFDSRSLRITDSSGANNRIRRQYRSGWRL